MKKIKLFFVFSFISIISLAQKPPIDHSVYDSWKSIRNLTAPENNSLLLYNINPQEGDNTLEIYNVITGSNISVPRGNNAILSENGQRVVAIIKPLFEQTRQAKIKKKKKDEMPKDTLAIIDIATGKIEKYPGYQSHKSPVKLGGYIAFQAVPEKETAKDTAGQATSRKPEAKKTDEEKNNLYILNIVTNTIDTLRQVQSYKFKQDGSLLAYITKPETAKKKEVPQKDSTVSAGTPAPDSLQQAPEQQPALYLYNPATKESRSILSGPKGSEFNLPVFSKNGWMAFYANTDTSKTGKKDISIYLYNLDSQTLSLAANARTTGLPEGWIINKNGRLAFSENGKRLFLGTSPRPLEKDTTLVDFEQPQLDIWSWDADYNPPMQLLNKEQDLKQTYTAYINIDQMVPDAGAPLIQLGETDSPAVTVPDNGNANYALATNNKKYRLQSQWDISGPADIYLIDVSTGERKLLYENVVWYMGASPTGKYYTLYDLRGKNWLLYNVSSGQLSNLTKDLPYPFYNIENDMPCLPGPYNMPVWFEDESAVLLSDQFDVWKFSPEGKTAPVRITDGTGRENRTVFNITLVYDHLTDNDLADLVRSNRNVLKTNEPLYFSTLNKTTKEQGFYFKDITKKNSKIIKLAEGPYSYRSLHLSKGKKPVYSYLKGNFSHPMDLWITHDNFKTEKQISEINPQQRNYNWGTVELVSWTTADSIRAEGLLFKPEDFDPAKKYPVMIYFYEKYSDDLYNYWNPAPSRSTVNIPYFVSNGYVVFIPDIYYVDGHPGQSAMRSIMPAVSMLEKYPWIDGENMAIQGQSWGGYQVAYMITQTNKFKAAGAGAPVSNMTSAYGGMRWGSGMVRQFQYEQTQSRIGNDLWSAFDLYYENSPLFFAPNITTPVLIMHNDKDGAVPWYQGIEFFTGLRRLGKVAWLLQYNNEDHNLTERKNAKDLSIRLEQFFNHYLKGAPMPEWMKYGRPAVKKDFDLGYKLVTGETEE